jgi:hypothetical protein
MFLVRPEPVSGESLSSWRQRVGIANGFKLFPLVRGEFKHTDSDLSPSDETLRCLSELTGSELEDIRSLTLRSLDGNLLQFGPGRASPRWVLPLRYTRSDRAAATQFCPLCLEADAHPYFRLHWRLALFSCCAVHGVRLLETCPKCGQGAWPMSAPYDFLFRDTHHPLNSCPVCRFDLRRARTLKASSPVGALFEEPFGSHVRIADGLAVPSVEFAEALWSICQLFVRDRPRRRIAAHQTSEGRLANSLGKIEAKSIEFLPGSHRHDLLGVVGDLFVSWPTNFLRFSEQHGLTAEQFSASRSSLPAWLEHEIDTHLTKQNRSISVEDVMVARNSIIAGGGKVTKSALGRIVGSKYGHAVQALQVERDEANQKERMDFLQQIENHCRAPARRKSSFEMRLRNAVALLLAILGRQPIRSVLLFDQAQVEEELLRFASYKNHGRFERKAAALATKLCASYEQSRSHSRARRSSRPMVRFFEGFRGGLMSERSIKKILQDCTTGLDPALKRNVTVFYVAARSSN